MGSGPSSYFKHGHATWRLKFGKCHKYTLAAQVHADEWENAMPKMIRHAGLALDDEKAVLLYPLAVRGE